MIPELELELLNLTGLSGGRMLELGSKANKNGIYKDYFVARGWEHVSVDWNGEHGCIALDLREPLDLGQFDVVTNFGTTEHVSEQEPCWRNVHEAIKPRGWLVSVTPAPGAWPGHGFWYPSLDWYSRYGVANHYTPQFCGTRLPPKRGEARRLNCYVAQKEDHRPFVMPSLELMEHNV